ALADLEARDRVLGARDDGPLAGDDRQLLDRVVERFRVELRLADAHVQGDLLETRDSHRGGEAELLLELVAHLAVVALLEPRGGDLGGAHLSTSFPHLRHTRTLWSSVRR